jgi:hypothetical protein
MRFVFIITFALLPIMCFSQYDTSYVMRFPGRLGVALYQSKPLFEIRLKNTQPVQGATNDLDFKTQAKYITGIGLHYDKLSVFAGIKTPGESDERKGKTHSSQFNIAFTGVKLRIEGSARFYSGFYENNSSNYIPSFNDSTDYYQNGDMKTNSLKLKVFYFFNSKKRFTYGAAYINNTRQIKSAGSFLVTANLYQFGVKNDGPIIPPYIASVFAPYDSVDKFKVTGLSTGIGYTHTFVIFKRFFLNLLFAAGVESQTLNLFENDKSLYKNTRTILSSYDFRSSLGYNSNRFYFSFHTIIDGNVYTVNNIEINNNFINSIFLIGYRFGVKIPVVDKFENK